MQLIYPERSSTSPEELAAGLRLHELAPPDRPYLGINMVSSLDGKATLDWRTRGSPPRSTAVSSITSEPRRTP